VIYGVALMPEEARDGEAALQLADQRLYASKRMGQASAKLQSRESTCGPTVRSSATARSPARCGRNVLEWRLAPDSDHRHPQAPSVEQQVILVCDTGYASSLAAASLQELGFARATDLDGGFQAWRRAGLPVTRGR